MGLDPVSKMHLALSSVESGVANIVLRRAVEPKLSKSYSRRD